MKPGQILIINMLLGIILWVYIFRKYYKPLIYSNSFINLIRPLVIFHAFRFIGLIFLIPTVTTPDLSPVFTIPGAYGDFITSIIAIISLLVLSYNIKYSLPLIWLFNIIGSLDLLNGIFIGATNNIGQTLGSGFYIVAIMVPALLVTHFYIFKLLINKRPFIEN